MPITVNNKIEEFKKRELPINHSLLSIRMSPLSESSKKLLDERIIEGYAVIWDSINDYGERFVKGCFAKSISEHGPESQSNYKIKMRDRHGKSVSLFEILKEDDTGLYFKTVPLDKVSWADDLLTQVRSGTINNFSIGFKHCWDKVEWDDEGDCMINLEARLFEISGVDIPSDIQTHAIRSSEERNTIKGDIESFISTLKKSSQIEARNIFSRCLTLMESDSYEERRSSVRDSKPKAKKLDYNFLIKKLN